MKLIIKMFLLLLMVGLVWPLWLKDPAGRPVMTVDDWFTLPDEMESFLNRGRGVLEAAKPAGEAEIHAGNTDEPEPQPDPGLQYYRWQDERGRWHFSDEPPPEGVTVQVSDLPELSNSTLAATAPAEDSTGVSEPMDSTIAPAIKLPDGVSREAIEQVLEESHQRRMGDEL
jgi:hypothetical protein